ncbi:siderophore-interacting protein [Vibrio viridaestus]|uniref:Siderophore-interacting protein n=1 Tax=Vibrio viridaestus TaxID=2487322 RepID=A0A3N9TKT5_9VIBR|nr:siderophore-interacting protein [Vibrio viridaestus]RQW64594.1 siderophore-interacting protein [Vibrio viridaestus]
MAKPKRIPYIAIVTSINDISPSIRRLTLRSSNTEQFTDSSVGGYFKFLFTKEGSSDISSLSENETPLMRTYTIRELNSDTGEITVDIVRHITDDMSCGFASRWAESVVLGDTISLVGPGKSDYPKFNRDAAIFVADMTSLPALAVTLKGLSPDTKGHIFIEVAHQDDIQELKRPENVELHWILSDTGNLADSVVNAKWPEGKVDVWCACEFDTMKALRKYFRNERGVEKDNIYISSYWKNGVSEDGHKVLKRADLENE